MAPTFSKLSTVALAVASSIVAPVDAFWRMPCRARTGLARIDPLVDYGVPSKHAHAIHGNGNFDMSCNATTLMADSPCTSCGVTEDKSVYWTPALYFEHDDGTTELVDQVGGMLAYYMLIGDDLKGFPEGFAMIAGDNDLRTVPNVASDNPTPKYGSGDTSQRALASRAIGFNCLNYATAPEGSLYRHSMPTKNYLDAHCTDGIRLELMFPSCWNGQDVRTKNNKAHVRYPSMVNGGDCPAGFETRLVTLFYETIWNTYAFKGQPGRFVLSNGDYSGNSYHGDFMMGWEEDLLQKAVDTCTNLSGNVQDCPLFTLQSDADAAKCRVKMPESLHHDDCIGPRKGLCGGDLSEGAATESVTPQPYKQKPAPSHPSGGYFPVNQVEVPAEPENHPPPPHKPKHKKPVRVTTRKVEEAYPSVTPPPQHQPANPGQDVVTTRRYTSDGAVYEVCVVEEDITVTATTTQTYHDQYRRHVHQHQHAHQRA